MKYKNEINFKVSGNYALFSDPITRVGGEKMSYYVPTYQALKGIAEAIYWKPTIIWYIDSCRVMNVIQTQSKGIRPIKYKGGNDLSIYTYLYKVEYQVKAHFEWNYNRNDLIGDRNEHKHFLIAKRMLDRGGKRDAFWGCRECVGYVEPCLFNEGKGEYDDKGQLDLGIMFHGYDYPSETGAKTLGIRLSRIVMNNGIINFERPEDCKIKRDVKAMSDVKPLCSDFTEDLEFVKENAE